MSCKITLQIHSGCKMYLSVQQCVKNSIIRNREAQSCRKISTFTKATNSMSLVRISHPTVKNQTIFNERWRLYGYSGQQNLVFIGCNAYSKDSKSGVEGSEKERKSEVKLSLYQKLKKMFKEYWYVLVPVHLITSSFWFGGFYYLAASGIDIPALLESFGAPESWIENLKKSKAGNLFLAYTLYKVASPARYTVTLGGTTISINYLKKWGWIKPVPNKEQIKRMYKEQKCALKDFKASYQDKMQVTKNEFLKTKYEMKQQYNEVKEGLHKSLKETRDDFKDGVKSGADEWKLIGRLCVKNIKNGWQEISGKK